MDGHRRHIYCGLKNDVSFNLPLLDKPGNYYLSVNVILSLYNAMLFSAYIHIAVLNADGARTEVCSFLPEGPDTHTNATDDDYLQYA